ncbi:MAG TPA: VOC family protein [Candidatus Acidoferrales bacterium]|nr:VOC family protein [Candidatus Acidoferrales bacterium]
MRSDPAAPLLFNARRLLVYVENLDDAIVYYRDVLGFRPLGGVEGTNFEFATSGPPLVLHKDGRASQEPRGRVGFVPSFQVAGIHELVELYRSRGVAVVHEVTEVPHGWVAFVADLEGNVLQIYQAKEGNV